VLTRYTWPPPRRLTGRGVGAFMANIPSQEKRIHRAERERLENRRRTSQVKTWFRRLESAVREGDSGRADSELRSLASRIDRAVKSGALHRNNGARKKSRAARIRSRLS
jgi:small subunit ribosomal protein S20